MGKPKHKDHRKENDSDSDNDDDIINIVAERLGKAIWEVTEADIAAYKNEDSDSDEEEEEKKEEPKEDEEEDEKDDEVKKEEKDNEDNTKKDEDLSTEKEDKDNIISTDKKEEEISTSPKEENKESTTQEEDKFPKIEHITNEITKVTEEVTYKEDETYLGIHDCDIPENIIQRKKQIKKRSQIIFVFNLLNIYMNTQRRISNCLLLQ